MWAHCRLLRLLREGQEEIRKGQEEIRKDLKALYVQNLFLAEIGLANEDIPARTKGAIVVACAGVVGHFEGEESRRIYLDAQTGGAYSRDQELKDTGLTSEQIADMHDHEGDVN